MRRVAAALAFAFFSAAAQAKAGETQCWIDHGAVLVPASFVPAGLGDITGDFILDLSAPQTALQLTNAQSDGVGRSADEPTSTDGFLTLAGEHIAAHVAVADLDAREWGFPTTINGVIGADLLAGYVVDLRFSPCRLTLRRRVPRETGATSLPLVLAGGVPTVAAVISDGGRDLAGQFAIDTGAAGVRISAAAARFSRLSPYVDPLSRDKPPARLASLSFGGVTLPNQAAALSTDTPDGVLGGIGTNVWSRYALRLDLRRRELRLLPPAP